MKHRLNDDASEPAGHGLHFKFIYAWKSMDTKESRLTPKVFETLLLLVENGGRVVGKEALLEAVWPTSIMALWPPTGETPTLRRISERRELSTVIGLIINIRCSPLPVSLSEDVGAGNAPSAPPPPRRNTVGALDSEAENWYRQLISRYGERPS